MARGWSLDRGARGARWSLYAGARHLSDPRVREKSDEESAQRKMAVSQQIRAARRRMSISAKRLAQVSGVPVATLRAVERCAIEVDRKTLEALADALGVSANELDLEDLP
jgi:ribosome-binding protein aMBF1 (putative translation factor)